MMMRRDWIRLIVITTCVWMLVSDFLEAFPRRRRRRRANARYVESGFQQIAPKVDAASGGFRPLVVNYSYEKANALEAAYSDRIRVFLQVWDEEVVQCEAPIVAEVKVARLSDSQNAVVRHIPVQFTATDANGLHHAFFDVENEEEGEPLVEPATVYRLFVNLHRESVEYGPSSVLGRIPVPYYVATSGEAVLDLARQQIVMRTFREFYYTERGWPSSESYPMDCYAYYMWATGICTVGAHNEWTILGNLFHSGLPFHSGSQIPELSSDGPIHADYVRQPGHSFMLLAYDPQLQQVWTMEANFNATIEVVNRYVGGGWTVGHLVDAHIRPEAFAVGQAE